MDEQYFDLEYKEAVQRELNDHVAQRLVDDATAEGRHFKTAMLSAINGYWDDVQKDIERSRITPVDAHKIIDRMLNARLLTEFQAGAYRERLCPA